jgi:hypothetical protein
MKHCNCIEHCIHGEWGTTRELLSCASRENYGTARSIRPRNKRRAGSSSWRRAPVYDAARLARANCAASSCSSCCCAACTTRQRAAPSEARVADAGGSCFELLPALKFADNKCQAVLKHVGDVGPSRPLCEQGDPTLHDLFARKFAEAGDLLQANGHYLRGSDTAAHVALVRRVGRRGRRRRARPLLRARRAAGALLRPALRRLGAARRRRRPTLSVARLAAHERGRLCRGLLRARRRPALHRGALALRRRRLPATPRSRSTSTSFGKQFFAIQPAAPPPNMFSMFQSTAGRRRCAINEQSCVYESFISKNFVYEIRKFEIS